MAHINNIRDADVHFTIDPITRAIKNAASTKTSVIQYDHNSERFTFMLPRYIEGHDMMECNKVEVHYINASSAATSGVYIVDDMRTDEKEENVLCSWLLSQNVTQEAGLLHFLLRFACAADDGSVEYAWNTGIYKGMSVASGMYNSGKIVEQYADVLAKWEKDIFTKLGAIDNFKTDIENSRKLKLLKTITLEEDVHSMTVEFDKPLDELAILWNVGFTQAVSDAFIARTDKGVWFMFYATSLALKTSKLYYYAHAKEITERQWETTVPNTFFSSLQGIANSTTTPKLVMSRRPETISRYLNNIQFYVPTIDVDMVAGSTIEIWGHEADENL